MFIYVEQYLCDRKIFSEIQYVKLVFVCRKCIKISFFILFLFIIIIFTWQLLVRYPIQMRIRRNHFSSSMLYNRHIRDVHYIKWDHFPFAVWKLSENKESIFELNRNAKSFSLNQISFQLKWLKIIWNYNIETWSYIMGKRRSSIRALLILSWMEGIFHSNEVAFRHNHSNVTLYDLFLHYEWNEFL